MKSLTYYYLNNNFDSKNTKPNETTKINKSVLKRNAEILNYFNLEQNKNEYIQKEKMS